MKNLILVGLVALVSWQAMASECPLRAAAKLAAAQNYDNLLVKSTASTSVQAPVYVKPGAQGAGTDSIRR